MSAEKRTRSQLTLPDEILRVSQKSPLKDARSVQRSSDTCLSSNKAGNDDDELLLSPRKPTLITLYPGTASKRSASPPIDEYTRRSESPSDNREPKRAKHNGEFDVERNVGNNVRSRARVPTHSRTNSEPIVARSRTSRKRSATTSKKPVSSSAVPPLFFSPTTPPGKERAQSVPLLSSFALLHVDLRNPPSSPRRPRSRSPSKESLRMFSGPTRPLDILQPIPDEARPKPLERDLPNLLEPGQASRTSTNPEISPLRDEDAPTEGPQIKVQSPSISTEVQITQTTTEPATPMASKSTFYLPLSPLTPLPETPLPMKFINDGADRYGELDWTFDATQIPNRQETLIHTQRPDPQTSGSVTGSQSTSMPPPKSKPKQLATTTTPSISLSKPGNQLPELEANSKLLVHSNHKPKNTIIRNAFQVLMEGSAHAKTEKKGKAKEKPTQLPTRIGSTTLVTLSDVAQNNNKINTKSDKTQIPKSSLKSSMRPRVKPNADAIPVPLVVSDEEAEGLKTEHDESKEENPFNFALPRVAISSRSTTTDISNQLAAKDTLELPDEPDIPQKTIGIAARKASFEPAGGINQIAGILDTDTVMTSGLAIPILQVNQSTAVTAPSKPSPSQSKARVSKLPTGKKRLPASKEVTVRVTRSSSSRGRNHNEVEPSTSKVNTKSDLSITTASLKRTVSGTIKTGKSTAESELTTSSLSSLSTTASEGNHILPGSPMKLSSPDRPIRTFERLASSSPAKTPSRSRIPLKSNSSPSPTKIARASSMIVSRQNVAKLKRTFTTSTYHTLSGSSLSTLANALEKLKMPAPARPNTSMGFNRDNEDDENSLPGAKARSQDDADVGRKISEAVGLQRAATLSAASFRAESSHGAPTTNKATKPNNPMQKPLTMFMSRTRSGSGSVQGGQSDGLMNRKSRIFGVGTGSNMLGMGLGNRRVAQKASRKTSLPSVMASPVKGADSGDQPENEVTSMNNDTLDKAQEDLGDVFQDDHSRVQNAIDTTDAIMDTAEPVDDKGKGKEKSTDDWRRRVSQRASLASQALSNSLNALPQPKRNQMGPPATPPRAGRSTMRSVSSTYPNTSTTPASDSSNSPGKSSSGPATRMSSRLAKMASETQAKGGAAPSVASAPASRKTGNTSSPANSVPDALKFMKDCVIFVDVKTDDGDEAGSLFVDMLEGAGARILTRVGQTCTHIVYKNGMTSTLNRYRLLRDPKPLVVGIAWVVECVEQRKQVDETNFLIDLDLVNVAGIIKRRRSMLPKLISRESVGMPELDRSDPGDADRSMDGSTSSLTIDDEVTPLEMARRRRSMLAGLRP